MNTHDVAALDTDMAVGHHLLLLPHLLLLLLILLILLPLPGPPVHLLPEVHGAAGGAAGHVGHVGALLQAHAGPVRKGGAHARLAHLWEGEHKS